MYVILFNSIFNRLDTCQMTVPGDLPPSFRGTGVRYVYAMIAAAKSTGDPVAVRHRILVCNPYAGMYNVSIL